MNSEFKLTPRDTQGKSNSLGNIDCCILFWKLKTQTKPVADIPSHIIDWTNRVILNSLVLTAVKMIAEMNDFICPWRFRDRVFTTSFFENRTRTRAAKSSEFILKSSQIFRNTFMFNFITFRNNVTLATIVLVLIHNWSTF